ncbi:MAG: Lrp/AsnC ligand binding domain-containing protein [Nitrosopumilus sp.]
MISCDHNLVNSAIEEIRDIPNVVAVDRLQGMYDIMIQLKASNETMKETIRTKIRYVEGVRSVLTLFVYNSVLLTPP